MIERITLAMTGASGVPYTMRLLECLVKHGKEVHFLMTTAAQMVVASESDYNIPAQPAKAAAYLTEQFGAKPGQITVYHKQDWNAPMASGTNITDAMVVCPCTSGSLAAFAMGLSDTLMRRAVDVTLKERKKLIVVHRETPISDIHLENMLKLSRMGAIMLPANPGFYYRPQSVEDIVDFVVGRILDHLDVRHDIVKKWGSEGE